MRAALNLRVVILDAPDMSPEELEAEVTALTREVLAERYAVSVETRVEAWE